MIADSPSRFKKASSGATDPMAIRACTSDDFQQLLKPQSITCSMNQRGECRDNAELESFLSWLKTERLSHKVYRT